MKTLEKIPITWEEILTYPEEVLRLEGAFEEYLEGVNEVPFKAQYLGQELILMGQVSDTYEIIGTNIMGLSTIYLIMLRSRSTGVIA